MSDNETKYLMPGLERGLAILALFTPEQPQLSLTDIAKRMGISRSSVFRLVFTLEKNGFVRRPGERRYRLGPKILSLGYNFVAGHDFVDVARPHLEELRDLVGASAYLAVLDGAEVLYLVRVPSRRALISNVSVGSRLPALTTTTGRILLSEMDEATLRAMFRDAATQAPPPGETMTVDAFLDMIAADRKAGVVAMSSRYGPGLISVAAPLRDQDGRIVAAINVSAPESLLTLVHARETIAPHVVNTARLISASLGYLPKTERASAPM